MRRWVGGCAALTATPCPSRGMARGCGKASFSGFEVSSVVAAGGFFFSQLRLMLVWMLSKLASFRLARV